MNQVQGLVLQTDELSVAHSLKPDELSFVHFVHVVFYQNHGTQLFSCDDLNIMYNK